MKNGAKYWLVIVFILMVISSMFFIYTSINREYVESTYYFESEPGLGGQLKCFLQRGEVKEQAKCRGEDCGGLEYYCLYKAVK